MKIFPIFSCLFLLFLGGCTSFAPDSKIPWPESLPDRFNQEDIAGAEDETFQMYSGEEYTPGYWWKNFGSQELNSLINEAISENFSIREAYSRLLQAHYLAVKAGAAKFPELDLRGGAAHIEQENGILQTNDFDEFSLDFSANYEVDLWGRIRAATRSEELVKQASREDLKTAMLSIAGQISQEWINLISNRKQQELFQRQLRLQKQLLELIKLRFSMARSTALDVYQQQQAIKNIEEALIPLSSQERNIKRRIALLLGKSDLKKSRLSSRNFPSIPEIPDPGLPADLLASRPDIQAAGLRLKSSEWEIAAARADRLPALRLTAAHNYSADKLSSLFDNWLTNLAANLAGPVFEGGRRRAEVERVRAVARERLAVYSRTVFTAVKEVEDALTEEMQYLKTIKSLKEQYQLSEKTIREARSRYLKGNSDFLNVLREELNILQIQQDLIMAQAAMITARVKLHLALGGSWADDYASEVISSGKIGKVKF